MQMESITFRRRKLLHSRVYVCVSVLNSKLFLVGGGGGGGVARGEGPWYSPSERGNSDEEEVHR